MSNTQLATDGYLYSMAAFECAADYVKRPENRKIQLCKNNLQHALCAVMELESRASGITEIKNGNTEPVNSKVD